MTSQEIIKKLLIPLGRPEYVDKGSMIILEGSLDDDAFYIVSGKVKVVHINREGYMTHLAVFNEGDIFGYYSSLTKSPRTATVLAEENTQLLRISGEATRKAIETYPGLKDQMMLSMVNEFINTKEKLIENTSVSSDDRIVSMLDESKDLKGRIETPRGWKTRQAEALGMSRENFSRQLSDLQKRGIVEIYKDYIIILN